MSKPVVSIVIPCHNVARWVAEAIDSCLGQTFSPIEVIAVDDGSTDATLEILQSYGNRILTIPLPHRNGNHARNRGFGSSKGEFIQFLDADDILLAPKIERQVERAIGSRADVILGDWCEQFHRTNGRIERGPVQTIDGKSDYLEALLEGWWVPPVAILYRRSIVERVQGWDESLEAAQDRDFFISVCLAGANVTHVPGCYSIYRRYGNVTVGTSNRQRWLREHKRVLDKAMTSLMASGRLDKSYRRALAQSYFRLARDQFDSNRALYAQLMATVLHLDPDFVARESRSYVAIQRLCGFYAAEVLASWKRRLFGM